MYSPPDTKSWQTLQFSSNRLMKYKTEQLKPNTHNSTIQQPLPTTHHRPPTRTTHQQPATHTHTSYSVTAHTALHNAHRPLRTTV